MSWAGAWQAGLDEPPPAVPGGERRSFPGCSGDLGTSTAACTAGAVSCHRIFGECCSLWGVLYCSRPVICVSQCVSLKLACVQGGYSPILWAPESVESCTGRGKLAREWTGVYFSFVATNFRWEDGSSQSLRLDLLQNWVDLQSKPWLEGMRSALGDSHSSLENEQC